MPKPHNSTPPRYQRAPFQELRLTLRPYPCLRMRAPAVLEYSGRRDRFLEVPIQGRPPAYSTLLTQPILTTELWDSQQNSARDAMGNWAKFAPPTVVNGKVYLATFSNQLLVYGLMALPDFSLTAAPSSQSVAAGSSASYIVYVNPQAGFYGNHSCDLLGTTFRSFLFSSLSLCALRRRTDECAAYRKHHHIHPRWEL